MRDTDPFAAADDAYAERVRASFARQTVMATLGATLDHVGPGEIAIALPYRAELMTGTMMCLRDREGLSG